MLNQIYFEKMKKHFDGDEIKTWKWFKTPNPGLGMVSPLDMIRNGRKEKLMQWIDNSLKGIFP